MVSTPSPHEEKTLQILVAHALRDELLFASFDFQTGQRATRFSVECNRAHSKIVELEEVIRVIDLPNGAERGPDHYSIMRRIQPPCADDRPQEESMFNGGYHYFCQKLRNARASTDRRPEPIRARQ